MFFFMVILLALSVLLEGTITTLPLTLLCLLCFTIVKREAIVFPIAFIAGFFLDILTLRSVGATSLFFIVCLFLTLLYQRKYEINSVPFVVVSSFVGAVFYLSIFRYGNVLVESGVSSAFALLLFSFLRGRMKNKIEK